MSMLQAPDQFSPLDLIEEFQEIDSPQTLQGRLFAELWSNRPADGLQLGRDIPSRSTAHLLSHLMVAELVEDGTDLEFVLVGESVRARFGLYAVGKRLSALVHPEVFAFHLENDKKLVASDTMTTLDVRLVQRHTGTTFESVVMQYDLILMPVWNKDRSRKVILSAWFCY